MQIRYDVAPDGTRRAITEGLEELGQFECVLPMSSDVTNEAAAHVLAYITDYLKASGQRILPGETMRYGWSTLRFSSIPNSLRLGIEELAEPFSTTADAYIPGASRAIAILLKQDETVRRNGISTIAHHPHRSELAIICRRISPRMPRPLLVLDRLKTRRQDDSGWFVGCGNADHDHNDMNELSRIHLVYLAELEPRIVYYMAMPEDTRVVFEAEQAIVFPPGEQEGLIDTSISA